MTQLTYLGNVITAAGRRPDPKKIDAITQMPKPKDTAQVRSFLGLINYYGAFVPEMRQIRAPLDALLKKDTPFNWNPECDAAFERAKEVLASDLLLTHYNPDLPIVVAADASDYGIGARHGEELRTNREGRACSHLRRPQVSPLYLWKTLHSSHGPQATSGHFWIEERSPSILGEPSTTLETRTTRLRF
ncbi:hypothetical protein V3C99_011471 [Haemonchus contortus]